MAYKKKKFFIIQQKSQGRGLFSLISAVICYLDFAEKNGYIPIVDFLNFPNIYNEKYEINGMKNSFEYYFEQVSPYTLDEVYSSGDYIISNNSYPSGYSYTIANMPELFEVYCRYIKIKTNIRENINLFCGKNFSTNVLGVHFRGKEMRTARGHWYPPSLKQMIKAIENELSHKKYDKIFVSSEDFNLIKVINKSFPNLVFWNEDYYRQNKGNAYKHYPRDNHFYKLGVEVLTDMIALSKCTSLISCSSNVPWFARFINNGKYESHLFINNGQNFDLFPFYKVSWYLKALMPEFFLGFKKDFSVFQEQIRK